MKTKKKLYFLTSSLLLLASIGFIGTSLTSTYAAPANYYDLYTFPTASFVINEDIEPLLWFDTTTNNPTDEIIVHLFIQEPGKEPLPFLYAEDERGELILKLTCPFGSTIPLWGSFSGWYSELLEQDYFHLNQNLEGWTLITSEGGQESFVFIKSKTTNGDYAPIVQGWEGVYLTNVDHPVSVNHIKSLLRANDDEDGDITSSIQINEDNYTSNAHILGSYSILFSVEDSAGNVATLTIFVKVVDATSPLIEGPTNLDSYLSNPLTLNQIKATLSVVDNYDTNLTLSLKEDQYSANKHKVGMHSITYETTDNSGNHSEKTIVIHVKDDIKPIVSGDFLYTRGSHGILTEATIRAGLSAMDNVDGNVSNSIELIADHYSSVTTKAGTYELHYRASDQAGNQSEVYIVYVTINDTIPPVFYVHVSILHIDDSLSLTQQQIIALLMETGQIEEGMEESVVFLRNDYQGTQTPGLYNLEVQVDKQDGTKKILQLSISVVRQEISVPTLAWYKSWHGWLSQWFGLKFVWSAIMSFFSSLF